MTIVRERDKMAKHAEHEDYEYIVNVTEISYGFVAIEAGDSTEAIRLARDIYADGQVSWASSSVSYTPADS